MERKDISVKSIVRMMVGEDIENHYPKEDNRTDQLVLEVHDLAADNGVSGLNLNLHRGEVLGLAGLVGSGRSEIAEALFGIAKTHQGSLKLPASRSESPPKRFRSASEAIRNGFALLTENRKTTGLFMNFSAQPNVTIAAIGKIIKRIFLFLRRESEETSVLMKKLSISPHAQFNTVETLSGGNQQKVLIARWLFSNADIFILDEPTRGIDVGAKVEVYETINEITRAGKGVILISADMDELMAMSDRIAIVRDKTIVEIQNRDDLSKRDLLEKAYVSGHGTKEN